MYASDLVWTKQQYKGMPKSMYSRLHILLHLSGKPWFRSNRERGVFPESLWYCTRCSCEKRLRNLWINNLYSVPTQWISRFCAWLRQFQGKTSIIPLFFCPISWKRADCPYIRLWKVFARRWQERTNWHRQTSHTADSHFSSVRDMLFSYSQTDIW